MIFWKVNNNGNDFIISLIENSLSVNYNEIAKRLCKRAFSIGADGLILIKQDNAAYTAFFYNADGTSASMCGNGLLCIGELIRQITENKSFIVNTIGGQAEIHYEDMLVCAQMPLITNIGEEFGPFKGMLFTTVDVGNKHAIARVKDVEKVHFEQILPLISPVFQGNISVISLINMGEFKIRTYEKGVGETNSCGSASTASYYVLRSINSIMRTAIAQCRGGALFLEETNDNHIMLKGTPTIVYKGVTIDD